MDRPVKTGRWRWEPWTLIHKSFDHSEDVAGNFHLSFSHLGNRTNNTSLIRLLWGRNMLKHANCSFVSAGVCDRFMGAISLDRSVWKPEFFYTGLCSGKAQQILVGGVKAPWMVTADPVWRGMLWPRHSSPLICHLGSGILKQAEPPWSFKTEWSLKEDLSGKAGM